MKYVIVNALLFILAGCGIKGDPVPPATPAEIGSGRPTMRGPYEGAPASIPDQKAIDALEDNREPEDEEGEENEDEE